MSLSNTEWVPVRGEMVLVLDLAEERIVFVAQALSLREADGL